MKKTITTLLILLASSLNSLHSQEFLDQSSCCPTQCCTSNGIGNFTIGGEWLWWKVEQQKMQVGSLVRVTPSTEGSFSANATVLKPHFKYDSGYRIFADYTTCDNAWKVSAIFTHAPSHARFNHVGDPAGVTFDFVSIFNMNFPLLNAISNAQFRSVGSRWNVDVNYFDFDLSRRFTFCECLAIKPHIGIRGIWIDQNFRINGIDTLTFTSHLKGRLNGVGLEGGVWGAWNVGCGLSLIGHFGGSISYAKAHNRGSLDAINADGSTVDIHYKDHDHMSLPTFDSFIGLAYGKNWCKTLITLYVGWEHHIIFNTNRFSISGGGDMTMQGLTLGGGVTF